MGRPPIIGGAMWRPVMDREGSRCACRGACGGSHRKEPDGKCPRPDGVTVAPRDLSVPLHVAVTLGPDDLTVWCDRCRAGSERLLRTAARAAQAATIELF